jgi:hypothetical protein
VPKKKEVLSDEERSKRILDMAQDAGVDNDPASFERAFAAVERGIRKPKKQEQEKK